MTTREPAAPQRVRPRDRKQRIEQAAATAFSRRGYHPVSMQDIADAVGISAPALYRHFPNKYELFARTALSMADRLIEATDAASRLPLSTPEEARAALVELVDAVCNVAIELRATAGIYRWEGRHLEREDRNTLNAGFTILGRRFMVAHRVYRPGVPESERKFLLVAALSSLASVTAHDTTLARKRLREMLTESAWTLLDLDVETYGDALTSRSIFGERAGLAASEAPASSRREHLLDAGIRLFAVRGYNEVTIEELAAEVGLTPSGVYRHFESKAALLVAAYDRASVWLNNASREVGSPGVSPHERLRLLCTAYIAQSSLSPDLMRVYFAEQGNLSDRDLRHLQSVQNSHMATWIECVRQIRPEFNDREAIVQLYTVFGMIADQLAMAPTFDTATATRMLAFSLAVFGLGGVDDPAASHELI